MDAFFLVSNKLILVAYGNCKKDLLHYKLLFQIFPSENDSLFCYVKLLSSISLLYFRSWNVGGAMGMFWVHMLLLLYRLCMCNGDYCFLVSNNVNFMKKTDKSICRRSAYLCSSQYFHTLASSVVYFTIRMV